MKFVSTRKGSAEVGLSEAIRRGAAPDGGLYLPNEIPTISPALTAKGPLSEFAQSFLSPYFAGDPLAPQLQAICAQALNVDVPLVRPDLGRRLSFLELFHGPTGAFKDFGARFLMACFDRIGDSQNPLTVLVATSGDTCGAVGCAAEGLSAVRAVILFPKGRVSPFQERQLTCWGGNVRALEVDGDFDDCQRMAKEAFSDPQLSAELNLTSANSINIGRLLPQAAYIAYSALRVAEQTGEKPGLIIPSGNLGHGFAALLARAMGIPIGPIIFATNENRTLKDWHESGAYQPRASVETLANAMDVGNPSNFERLSALSVDPADVAVELVDDEAITARIASEYAASGYVLCPHTATTAEAFIRLSAREQGARPWIAFATAHPFKFAETVQPLVEEAIETPPALAAIFSRPTVKRSIGATTTDLAAALREPVSA